AARLAVHDAQVPHDARRRGGDAGRPPPAERGDRTTLQAPRRSARHRGRSLAPQVEPRRAAPAPERAAREHEPRRPPSAAPRGGPRVRGLAVRPARGSAGDLGPVAGERAERALVRRVRAPRPVLHRELVARVRLVHPREDDPDDPRAERRVLTEARWDPAPSGDGWRPTMTRPSPLRFGAFALGPAIVALGLSAPGSAPRARAAGVDPVIAAAGDIACDPTNPAFNGRSGTPAACRMRATSDILVALQKAGTLSSVLTLGDNQYRCGGLKAFKKSYDPTWGRVKTLTHPTPGDHEYMSTEDS